MPPRPGRLPAIRALQTRSGRLGFILSGRGGPAIVLFSGAGVALDGWTPLYPGIESLATVFGWNRFGMQGSDAPRFAPTGAVVIASLRELLGYAGVEPPYLLVGHSLGGLYANLLARLHPREVGGVLFLESAHPHDGELLHKQEDDLVRSLEKRSGLPRLLFQPNVHAELACVEQIGRELAAAGAFPDVPVRVITGGLTPRGARLSPAAIAAKRAHQQELARLSPRGAQVIAHCSGHFPQWTEPQLVLQVLRELLASARTGAR